MTHECEHIILRQPNHYHDVNTYVCKCNMGVFLIRDEDFENSTKCEHKILKCSYSPLNPNEYVCKCGLFMHAVSCSSDKIVEVPWSNWENQIERSRAQEKAMPKIDEVPESQ